MSDDTEAAEFDQRIIGSLPHVTDLSFNAATKGSTARSFNSPKTSAAYFRFSR